jgi:hypothetical protein
MNKMYDDQRRPLLQKHILAVDTIRTDYEKQENHPNLDGGNKWSKSLKIEMLDWIDKKEQINNVERTRNAIFGEGGNDDSDEQAEDRLDEYFS